MGGCVRDLVLARTPNDFDITTSARPEEIKACFRRTIDTGIRHGTVTVMLEEQGFEVTTYRVDGAYSDGRHPDEVHFTRSLIDDLKRRDFTINAMAYGETEGLVDYYGGMRDLQKKVVRCVGRPDERFEEDSLRVMRAVRFAAQLGFTIEPLTAEAAKRHAPQLERVSAERIREELMKLITSPHPETFGQLYELGITSVILPEFDLCMKTEQNTKHHLYNVGVHTVKSMCEITNSPALRLTMLLHDLGKPMSRTTDESGTDHFKGHAAKSARIANEILRRLKFDNNMRKRVVQLVRWHDLRPKPRPEEVRKAICIIGRELFEDYLAVQWADNMAKSEYRRDEKLQRIVDVFNLYREIIKRGDCLSVAELAIDGNDLLELGIKGPAVGEVLKACLDTVLQDPGNNNRTFLLEVAKDAAGTAGEQPVC